MSRGLSEIEVRIKGPGGGRESAVRALKTCGLNITSIMDITLTISYLLGIKYPSHSSGRVFIEAFS